MTLNELKAWDGALRQDDKPPMPATSLYIEMDSCHGDSVALWVAPDTDLDGTFSGICADTGEILTVNGWLGVVRHSREFDEHGKLQSERVRLFF
jgi:hypothetical protein